MMGILRKRRGFDGKVRNGILRILVVKRQRTENAARIEGGGLMILILLLLWIGFGLGSGDMFR